MVDGEGTAGGIASIWSRYSTGTTDSGPPANRQALFATAHFGISCFYGELVKFMFPKARHSFSRVAVKQVRRDPAALDEPPQRLPWAPLLSESLLAQHTDKRTCHLT